MRGESHKMKTVFNVDSEPLPWKLEMALRLVGGGLTVGLLIVLPALKILGWV